MLVVTHLSSNAGTSASRFVWAKKNCYFMSDFIYFVLFKIKFYFHEQHT